MHRPMIITLFQEKKNWHGKNLAKMHWICTIQLLKDEILILTAQENLYVRYQIQSIYLINYIPQ